MATDRQTAANRLNGLKGGPKTPEGKAVVRLNARKHGIFAQALTGDDAEEAAGIYARLARWLRPVGEGEEILVDQLAHIHLSMHRCAEGEAQYYCHSWRMGADADPADAKRLEAWMDRDVFETSVRLFQRYGQTLTNRFLKVLHEVRAEQKRRREGKGQDEEVVFVEAEDELEEELAGAAQPPAAGASAGTTPCETNREDRTAEHAGGQALGCAAPDGAEPPCETNPIRQNMAFGNEIGGSTQSAAGREVRVPLGAR